MRLDCKRVRAIVTGLSRARVMVVGDIMLDEYIWGDTSRISPEAPVPIVKVARRSHGLGGAGNVVQNLRAVGAKASIVAAIGDDARGEHIRTHLEKASVDMSGLVVLRGRPTTGKTRILARGQQVVRVDDEVIGDFKRPETARVTKAVLGRLDDVEAVIISDYGKGLVTSALLTGLIPEIRKKGKIVAIDPKYPKYLEYKGASLITPNTKEAGEFLHRTLKDEKDVVRGGKEILRALGCDHVLITRGGEGMSLVLPRNRTFHIPALATEVFDVTGAGDTVISLFTACLATGASPVEAAHVSNLAAAVVVRKVGAATASTAEIVRMFGGPKEG